MYIELIIIYITYYGIRADWSAICNSRNTLTPYPYTFEKPLLVHILYAQQRIAYIEYDAIGTSSHVSVTRSTKHSERASITTIQGPPVVTISTGGYFHTYCFSGGMSVILIVSTFIIISLRNQKIKNNLFHNICRPNL